MGLPASRLINKRIKNNKQIRHTLSHNRQTDKQTNKQTNKQIIQKIYPERKVNHTVKSGMDEMKM